MPRQTPPPSDESPSSAAPPESAEPTSAPPASRAERRAKRKSDPNGFGARESRKGLARSQPARQGRQYAFRRS